MKRIFFILLTLSILFAGCSKDDDGDNTIVDETEDFLTSNKEGVAEWKAEDYVFDRYYSLLDTIGIVKVNPVASVKYSEGSPVTITWYVNQMQVENTEIQKLWLPDIKMWISGNKPNFEVQKLTFGDKIKAVVTINSKSTTREATITYNKIVTDVLGVTFGLPKSEVEEKERKRMEPFFTLYPSSWREYIPNIAVLWCSSNIQDGITIYRFTNGNLTGIGEYITNIEITESLAEYCKRLGLKETPKLTESGALDKPYTWNNGKIEFSLSIIEDAPVSGTSSNTCKALGISYKKL